MDAYSGTKPVAQQHAFDSAVLQAHLEGLLERSQRGLGLLLQPRADGSPVQLQLAAPRPAVIEVTMRRGSDGGLVTYWRDMTAESEVDRMKSEFLSTAAHELRTPMVSIFGFTELLLNRPMKESMRVDLLQTIHRQSSLLIRMVNELLDLARIDFWVSKGAKLSDRVSDLAKSYRKSTVAAPAVAA